MVQTPSSEPRSVPDPDGDLYDEMLRQERLKQQLAEAKFSPAEEHFSPEIPSAGALPDAARGLDFSAPRTPPDAPFSIVPSTVSPAELAQRRQALGRVFLMADYPLAEFAYGFANLANASPQRQDQALASGAALSAVMVGAAPFGSTIRGRPSAPTPSLDPLGWDRPAIRYGELNADNQATGVTASLTQRGLSGGTRADPRQTPAGWGGDGIEYNEARGHLLARQLGGRGDDPRNLVTLTQRGSNSPQMSTLEGRVARRVRSGEFVEYSASPLYADGTLPPTAVLVTATGSRQPPVAQLFSNPAARRR